MKQHLALEVPHKAPIGVYYFNYKGRASHSYSYTYTTANFGVVHSDELLYLFRNTAIGADFPVGSPEWIVSKGFVDYFVKIAYGRYDYAYAMVIKESNKCFFFLFRIPGPTCSAKDCKILEFTNSGNPKAPAALNLINGFDEEMYKFWQKFYSLQGI